MDAAGPQCLFPEIRLPLLICADPGARAHFVGSWLHNQLTEPLYDVGRKITVVQFTKFHTDWHNANARVFTGLKIRIRPSLAMIDTHMYLFLTKNVYQQIPDFPRDGITLQSTEKMIEFAKECFYHDDQIEHDVYDHVMMFEDTYDSGRMVDLYHVCNGKMPSQQQIDILQRTNDINRPDIDRNHCCAIAAMILKREAQCGLSEIDRYWSLQDIYRSTPTEMLCSVIDDLIRPENYGKSDFHQEGINSMTKKIHERKRNGYI